MHKKPAWKVEAEPPQNSLQSQTQLVLLELQAATCSILNCLENCCWWLCGAVLFFNFSFDFLVKFIYAPADNHFSEHLRSEKPVYATSKLSKAVERPYYKHPLYTAFHGPTANNSDYTWYNSLEGGVVRKILLSNARLRQVTMPLYLYHGEIYLFSL